MVFVRGGMADPIYAKLFTNGRSQAVRLPKAFRLPGDKVLIQQIPEGILLQPTTPDLTAWLADVQGKAKNFPRRPAQPKAQKRSGLD